MFKPVSGQNVYVQPRLAYFLIMRGSTHRLQRFSYRLIEAGDPEKSIMRCDRPGRKQIPESSSKGNRSRDFSWSL